MDKCGIRKTENQGLMFPDNETITFREEIASSTILEKAV